ncbi:hypothetical protein [Anaerotignum sp.]|uniref:hypothetical protein n=1 Tax=Anaerotignum sp. TaxID=2039241 RepID=UPI0027148419|nr:hypothetical protein [Anaerotignum sp.]
MESVVNKNLTTELLPENDMQELQELNGRVKATLTYIEAAEYPESKVIYAMLGGKKEDVKC